LLILKQKKKKRKTFGLSYPRSGRDRKKTHPIRNIRIPEKGKNPPRARGETRFFRKDKRSERSGGAGAEQGKKEPAGGSGAKRRLEGGAKLVS